MTGTPTHVEDRSVPRKATLFCPRCGHRSPVDGDWCYRRAGDYLRVRCPDCHHRIADRPRSAETPAIPPGPAVRTALAGTRALLAGVRLWRTAAVPAPWDGGRGRRRSRV